MKDEAKGCKEPADTGPIKYMTWVEEAGGASMRGFMLSEKDISLDCFNSWRDRPTQDNGL